MLFGGEAVMPCQILVIEENKLLAAEIVSTLQEAGYMVASATTGPQGLLKLARSRPHLVVVSYDLSLGNGERVCLRVLEICDALVVVIGSEPRADVPMLEAGADAYLLKPFRPAELVARVRSLLRRRKAPVRDIEASRAKLQRSERKNGA
jgi:DNA-binding response OmpR family regulator